MKPCLITLFLLSFLAGGCYQEADAVAKRRAYKASEARRAVAEEQARKLESELRNTGATPVTSTPAAK